jgi:aspartate/methionine/tyrosine aminotransferase
MDGEPRFVRLEETESGWQLDLDRLFGSVDERTRAIFINSPSNPTGWMMPAEDQQKVLDWCRERGIWVIADEVYDRIAFDLPRAPSFLDIAEPDDLVIRVNSFSKTWCMTGWRLGWVTAPEAFGPTLEKMTEYNVANAPSMAQHAGIVALRDGNGFVQETVERYRVSRDAVYQRLGAFPRVRLSLPRAAFYAFFEVDGVGDSLAFAKKLVREARVGLAPGIAFGAEGEGHMRLCFAASVDTLSRAMDRLEPALR